MIRICTLAALLALTACAQDSTSGGSGASAPVDFATAMANADAKNGKRQYLYCQACHSLTEGGMNKVGPNLHGVFGRPAAQASGFIYSDALKNSGFSWDAETLDRWIKGPASALPGTTMVFAGVSDQQQRADLIAYLQQATAAE